jgi:hypothetical protein
LQERVLQGKLERTSWNQYHIYHKGSFESYDKKNI